MRNLKTSFFTYAGVVQALEGVSFDMQEGETLGLVGETGCGKSVTALSILRLIPQPPGRIEEGEVLFDLPREVVEEIERLEATATALLQRIFGDSPEARPDDLSIRRLRALWEAARKRPSGDPGDLDALRVAATALIRLKEPRDLLARSDQEMREIRGNKIAMIFQDPMQALNPVFSIGDQIAENILLHQKAAVVESLVKKMDLEGERDGIARALGRADPGGKSVRGRLPEPRPVATGTLLLALAWLTVGAIAAVAHGSRMLSTADGLSGFLLAVALAQVLTALALLTLKAWVRRLAIGLAGLDALIRVGSVLLTVPLIARISLGSLTLSGEATAAVLLGLAFHVVALGVDFLVLRHITREGAAEGFSGRHAGWVAALLAAEGEPNDLEEVRGLIASSGLENRETFVERIDGLVEAARSVLLPGEPITGHFRGLVPRNLQLAAYRTVEAHGTAVWERIPVIRRLLMRPLKDEGIRWGIEMLRRVRIPDPERIAHQYPYELSGGMQQRSLIAIALSCHPRLLIADEPTTALDVTIQAQILELIRDMKRGLGSSVLIITHDLGIIADMCDRVCVMYAGCIVENAPTRAVFKAPLHPYSKGLMKAIPSHTVRKDRLEIIRGSVPNLIYPPPGCRFHPRCPAVMPTCGWSAAEVGVELRDVMRTIAEKEPSAFDVETVEWNEVGPTELRVTFPEGITAREAVSVLRKVVEAGRGRPALGAVRSVEALAPSGGGDPSHRAIVRILEPRKPPSFVPQPDHSVACLLYEEGVMPLQGSVSDSG